LQYILFSAMLRHCPRTPLFPYTTLFRSPSAGGGRRPPGFRTCDGRVVRRPGDRRGERVQSQACGNGSGRPIEAALTAGYPGGRRSEEHTSELQSRENLVCRLLLEKKNTQ